MPSIPPKKSNPDTWNTIRELIELYAGQRKTLSAKTKNAPVYDKKFKAFCARHRITPIVAAAVNEQSSVHLSKELIDWLADERQKNAAQLLQQANLIRSIDNHPKATEFKILKGITAAHAFYKSPADRHAGDIDILLKDSAAVENMEAVLSELDAEPLISHQQYDQSLHSLFFKVEKHSVWIQQPTASTIELHWLTPNLGLFPDSLQNASSFSRLTTVSGHLDSLKDSHHFLYLCAHGTRSAWRRLKWIVDLYLLNSKLQKHDWKYILESARENCLERHLGIALAVLNHWFPNAATERSALALANNRKVKRGAEYSISEAKKSYYTNREGKLSIAQHLSILRYAMSLPGWPWRFWLARNAIIKLDQIPLSKNHPKLALLFAIVIQRPSSLFHERIIKLHCNPP